MAETVKLKLEVVLAGKPTEPKASLDRVAALLSMVEHGQLLKIEVETTSVKLTDAKGVVIALIRLW
jgi:hypothetical protein